MTMTTYENDLKNIYYDPSNPGSYGSVNKLYNEARKNNPFITIDNVKDWLTGENTYTLHRNARKNYQREKILVSLPNEQFQADLVDMQAFATRNKNFKFILTVIDCFTRYAFAIPVKNKTGLEIKNALIKVFNEQKPSFLQTDRGKEFLNKPVQDLLKINNIRFFTSQNSTFKCAIVERFNRTLKSKMFKYFTAKGTRQYLDVLPQLVKSYNRSFHRTINCRPIDVRDENKNDVFYNIYKSFSVRDYLSKYKIKQHKLKVGDKVRRKYELTPMDKSYYPTWTDSIYTIDKTTKGRNQQMYSLIGLDGEKIHQRFYPEEIQKIKENLYRIEKIVKKQTVNKKKGYIVKWVGFSDKHNSWVPEEGIVNLKNG